MKLFALGIFWACGLVWGFYLDAPIIFLLFLLLIPFSLFLFSRHNSGVLLFTLCLSILLLGAIRSQLQNPEIDKDSLSNYQNFKQSEIQGVIYSEISGRNKVLRFEINDIKLNINQEWHDVKGKALVETIRNRDYKPGDRLLLKGILRPVSEAGEYYGYLEKQGVSSWISFPQINLLQAAHLNWFQKTIYDWRTKLSYSLSSSLPEPQGSMAQALLLGVREEIPAELNRDFKNTGTIHLLAISGMNLSIFAGMVISLGIWLFGRRYYIYLIFAFLLVWLYTLLSGMNPPVMRAAFMASAYFLAEFLGRPHSGAPVLALSAIIMTAIEPSILLDVSFQLSFMAMSGLTFITPIFIKLRENLFHTSGFSDNKHGFSKAVWDMASTSAGAILATLPLTAFYFKLIPLAGLPATILSSLTLPYIIIVSFLTALSGIIFPLIGHFIGMVDWLFLSYMLVWVKAFSSWPFISLDKGLPALLIFGYYIVLISATLYITNRNMFGEKLSNIYRNLNILIKRLAELGAKYKKSLIAGLVLANLLVWAALFSLPDRFTHISFLDVGHGDAIFIQTPKGHQVLIDGGPDLYKTRLYLGERMPFWDRKLDMVILTHPHEDHLAGLPQVFRKYRVDYTLDPQPPVKSLAYENWLKYARDRGSRVIAARDGLTLNLDNNNILEILHPSQDLDGEKSKDIDNRALVLRLTSGKFKFLLPSDNRAEGQREVLFNHPDIWSTVLVAPHHGSIESIDQQFTAAVSPSSIVISSDLRGSESRETVRSSLKELFPRSQIFTTSENGSIEFITDGQRLWVKSQR